MRKILTLVLIAFTSNFVFSQDSGGRFRFGLKVTPSVNWYKPEGKIITNNGTSIKYGGGLVVEYELAKVACLQTGLQIDVNGGSVKYNNGTTLTASNSNSVSYYYNTLDDKIIKYESGSSATSTNLYQLNGRSYSISYITIPLNLKMKTGEIGGFTYYGLFGINNSFRWKARANDEVQQITTTGLATSESKSKIEVTKDVNIYAASLNMGLGAEMNLAGTTSLTFGINYLLGFTNVVKNNSDYLERRANDSFGTATYTPMPQVLKSNAVVLLVGILF